VSQSASHIFVERNERSSLGFSRRDEQRTRWHHHSQLRNQIPGALDAAIDTDAATADQFCLANGGVEKFRDAQTVQHLCHSHFPADFFVAKTAKGNCGKNLTFVASEFALHPTKYGYAPVPHLELVFRCGTRNATGARS
jgi:hypothetical protein